MVVHFKQQSQTLPLTTLIVLYSCCAISIVSSAKMWQAHYVQQVWRRGTSHRGAFLYLPTPRPRLFHMFSVHVWDIALLVVTPWWKPKYCRTLFSVFHIYFLVYPHCSVVYTRIHQAQKSAVHVQEEAAFQWLSTPSYSHWRACNIFQYYNHTLITFLQGGFTAKYRCILLCHALLHNIYTLLYAQDSKVFPSLMTPCVLLGM